MKTDGCFYLSMSELKSKKYKRSCFQEDPFEIENPKKVET